MLEEYKEEYVMKRIVIFLIVTGIFLSLGICKVVYANTGYYRGRSFRIVPGIESYSHINYLIDLYNRTNDSSVKAKIHSVLEEWGFAMDDLGRLSRLNYDNAKVKELYLKAMGVRGDLAKGLANAETDEERAAILREMGFSEEEIEEFLKLDSEYAKRQFLKEHGFSDEEIEELMAMSEEEQREYLEEKGWTKEKIEEFENLTREDAMMYYLKNSKKSKDKDVDVEISGEEESEWKVSKDYKDDEDRDTEESISRKQDGEDGLITVKHVIVKRNDKGEIVEKWEEGWEEGEGYYREFENTIHYTYDNLGRVIEQVINAWDSETNQTTTTTITKRYEDEDHPTHASYIRIETEDANGNITVKEQTDITYENGEMVSWHEKEVDGDMTKEMDVWVKRDSKTGNIIERYEEGWEEGVDDEGNDYYREFQRTVKYWYDNLDRVIRQEIEAWDSETNQTVYITKEMEYNNPDWPTRPSYVYTEMYIPGKGTGYKERYIYSYDSTGQPDEYDDYYWGNLGEGW